MDQRLSVAGESSKGCLPDEIPSSHNGVWNAISGTIKFTGNESKDI
jgi:hypothetical protein